MIDREAFKLAWKHLCARFSREYDSEQAAAYYEYLNEQLDTETFLAAARAVWAGGRFFPRPADFLLVSAAGEWRLVLKAVEEYRPPDATWYEYWKQLTPRAVAACKQLGGVEGMRTIFERDVLRLKAAWEQAYEQETASEALLISAGRSFRLLEAAR